jgi:methylmalonyl-CoA mutase N-terminal domain/subunit
MNDKDKLSEAKNSWEEKYRSYQEREEVFVTNSGIPVEPLYTSLEADPGAYLEQLGFPGERPYTRGVYPTMYRGRLWTIRQLAGYGTAEDTNERFRFLLAHGATGINCVFDYATLRGYDPDAPEAEGDVGQGGVSICAIDDVEQLFDGIPLDKVSVSLVACNPVMSLTIMAMYLAVAKKRGISWDRLAGTIQNDFLMETAITTAPQVLQPAASFKLSTDIVEYCSQYVPRWNPISYTGYNYREAGADAIQEVAIMFADALGTIQEMIRRGYAPEQFVPRLSFFFSADSDFFEEIAKYRAARRLWCRLMSEQYKITDPSALTLRYHVQTAGWTLTAQEPLNNVVRAAYQALAAALGGAQSIHVDGYDEALCIPTEQAALIALRTQQILQNETNVTHTIDPLGGGYFIESLTNEMEGRIRAYVEKIEEAGGIVKVVQSGWLHSEIASSAYRTQKSIEGGQRKIVGLNFCSTKEQQIEIFRPDPQARFIQLEKLAKIRQTRNRQAVFKSLDELHQKCRTGENIMDAVINAVEVKATVGEIGSILRQAYGTWKMPLY